MSLLLLWIHLGIADVLITPDAQQSSLVTFTVLDPLSNPVSAATVRVTVHPGIATERQWTLGITDAEGRITFTPEVGGPYQLEVGNERLDFRVNWTRVAPETGFSLFLFLGLLGLWIHLKGRRGTQ